MFSTEGESKESGDKRTPWAPQSLLEREESKQPVEGARPRLHPLTSDPLPGEGVGGPAEHGADSGCRCPWRMGGRYLPSRHLLPAHLDNESQGHLSSLHEPGCGD